MSFGQKVTGTGVTRYEKVEVTDGGDGKWHYRPAESRAFLRSGLRENGGQDGDRQAYGRVLHGRAHHRRRTCSTASDTNPLAGTTAAAHDFDTRGSAAAAARRISW
jgi:hypothetical protein